MSCTEGKPFFPRNVIMKTEDHSASTIAAMIASCTPVALQGARSTMSRFESAENPRKRMSCSSYSALDLSDEMGDEDGSDDCGGHPGEKKRRLTFEQVKTLEKNFELGNKLDPERKMYLATTLGLQPRQIAIWFQNRRARWKTKQLERDFDVV